MNKKILTAFLFGATVLASTSTFVSCKDYDDDIKAVQSNLDSEITARKALEEKVTAAQTAITTLQSAVADLQKHESECDSYRQGQIEELGTEEVKLAGQIADLQAAQKTLEDALAAQTKKEADDVVALNAAIDQALIDAKAYTDAAIALEDAKVAATYATIESVNKQIEDVNNKIADVLNKYEALSSEIAEARGSYSSLKAALDAQNAALEKALKAGDDATLAAAKQAVEDAKKALEEHETACDAKVDAALTEIYKAFDSTDGTIGGLKTALENMKVDITDLKNYTTTLKDVTIPAIESDIDKVNSDLAVMTIILSSQLRSLVFMPYLYVDGIEATRYRVLTDTVLEKFKCADIVRTRTWSEDANYETVIGCKVGSEDKGVTTSYKITNLYDWHEPTSGIKAIFYGPTWPVDYHANPTSADVQFSEIKGFKVLQPTVITRSGTESQLGVTAEQYYPDGSSVFNNNRNGELVVGIKVANPSYLFDGDPNAVTNQNVELANTDPKAVGSIESGTGHWSKGTDNTVALQVYEDDYTTSKTTKDTITSDYAMLYGTKVFLEGIIWNTNVGTKTNDGKLDGKGYASPWNCVSGYSRQEDTDEWYYNAMGRSGMKQEDAHTAVGTMYRCKQHIHVYDTPEEALFDKNPVMLEWDNTTGIKLEDYLALHWYEENVNRTGWENMYTTKFTDKSLSTTAAGNPWIQYGLSYDFEFCNYRVGDNKTSDSKYAYWKDNKDNMNSDKTAADGYFSETGTIIAGSVDESGEYDSRNDYGTRLEAQNKQSVHREPLVRVRVKKGNDILLDGYILVHITAVPQGGSDVTIEASNEIKFDLCNDAKALAFDWADFTKIILQDTFKGTYPDGITKTQFDEWFGGDKMNVTFTDGTTGDVDFGGAADGFPSGISKETDGGYSYDCDLFTTNSSSAVANKDTYGRVRYYLNESGTTNNEFVWYLTAEEMEKITHNDNHKGTATVYIRWTGKAGAPCDYLWIKLTVTVTRVDVDKYKLAQKDINYWYDYTTGDHTGDNALSAVLLNVESPKDGGNTTLWNPSQLNNWLVNHVFIENATTGKLLTSGNANVTTFAEPIAASPIDGQTTKTQTVVGAKFYFVPVAYTVNVPTPHYAAKYEITPYNGSTAVEDASGTNNDWNKLVPRYATHKLAATTSYFTGHDNLTTTPALPTCKLDTKKTWSITTDAKTVDEDAVNKIINECAIDYNAGCFDNNKLYAHNLSNNTYTLIATLDQHTGVLTLKHYTEGTTEYNVVCDVLNAVGYDNDSENHHANNIAKELRTRIGVIATTKCDLAAQMQDATWMTSWERPINVADGEKEAIDAKTNGNKVYMTDVLSLYDWRGPTKGDMNKAENVWLWAYYNIHYITVDCTPEKVLTNLHYGGETWSTGSEQYMSKINPAYNRLFADSLNNRKATYQFNLHKYSYERNFNCGHPAAYHNINNASWSKCGVTDLNFNYATRSERLYDIFHSDPYTYVSKTGNHNVDADGHDDGTFELKDHKADFGYIWYDNNMDNVEKFYVIVPVTIGYDWGCFTTNVKVWIHPTEGNAKRRR